MALVGLLHRAALTTPWADDRELSENPAWFQLAAPDWHADVPGSSSIAAHLVRVVDPLTSASSAGDARAFGALLTAVAAAMLLAIFSRAGVPVAVAGTLCGSLVAAVLPVSATTSVAYALQLLLASALLLVWASTSLQPWVRIAVLSAITVVGAMNHAAFAAFALGVWLLGTTSARLRAAAVGAAFITLLVALLGGAWMLAPDANAMSHAQPAFSELATALVTGRFEPTLQPLQHGTVRAAFTLSLPGPAVLCLPLMLIGLFARDARRLGSTCAAAMATGVVFAGTTWLPDSAIALAPARMAAIVLVAVGVAWVWQQPIRGGRVLALAVSAFLGVQGFIGHAAAAARRESAEMQGFAEAADAYIGSSPWTADRMSLVRAVLLRDNGALQHSRNAVERGFLQRVPADERLVMLTGGESRLRDGGTAIVPQDLSHPSAASFLASQPPYRWLAVALRGNANGEFCRDLLGRLGVADAELSAGGRVVLARIERQPVAVNAVGRLHVPYGEIVRGEPAPAVFELQSEPAAQVRFNGARSEQLDHGMVVTFFEPWRAEGWSWTVGDCERPNLPHIDARRLKAAAVVEANQATRIPDVPVLDTVPVDVHMGERGSAWFVSGWHGPEGAGAHTVRWTSARDADVNVITSHQQALRVQIDAYLAERQPGANTLGLSWNGTQLEISPGAATGVREFAVPKHLVKRGINTLTVHVKDLVSPASQGNSSDDRLLGAAVSRITIIPTP